MNINKKILLFCALYIIVLAKKIQAQTEPTIATCDGQQTVCLSQNNYDLCVKITVRPGLAAPIDHFMIDWGDGIKTRVDGSSSPQDQSHRYNFSNFFKTCVTQDRVTVLLETFLSNNTVLNNAFILTVRNPPTARFEFNQSVVCIGERTCFQNTSCPSEALEIVSWDYGDGAIPNTEGCYTYTRAGTFPVTLTVRNGCDTARITKNISVIEAPIANARPLSGVNDTLSEPFVVCIDGNNPTTVILDGSTSQNATSYEWRPASANGIRWLSNRRNVRDTLQFTRAGDYTITLTVNNPCDRPSEKVLQFRVINAVALTLNAQTDACESISYTPSPFVVGATYKINGEIISDFPRMLSPGSFLIEASLSNECGPILVRDTFEVRTRRTVQILNRDTTVCSGSPPIPILLSDSVGFGTCLINNIPLLNCVFDPSMISGTDFIITYGGECLASNSVQFKVIQTGNLRLEVPQTTYCIEDNPFTVTVNESGGRFFGRGFADALSGLYDPQRAGVGKDTIRYELSLMAGGNESCPASATRVVEVFPTLEVDFTTKDCSGNTITFDTIRTSQNFSSIRYDFGDGRSSNNASPSHTYNAPGTYTVSVTLSQTGGCSTTQTKQITVEPPPVAAFAVAHESVPCSPLSVDIIDGSTGNNLQYQWNFGNGQTSTLANPPPIVFEAVGRDTTYIISLTVTNGCSSRNIERPVFVKAGPNPGFAIDKDLHCSGEQVAFQRVNANANDNNDFWFWEFGDGRTFDGKNAPPIIYESNVRDTFLVSLTVGNECDTTTFSRPIVVIPSDVTAFLNVDKTIACSGADVRFINESGVPNAEFFFSDGASFRGDTVLYRFSTLMDSIFSVKMRIFGCGYDDTTLLVRILPMPMLSTDIQSAACTKEAVDFTVNSDVADIQVFYGDGNSTRQRLSQYTYLSAGNYEITTIATSVSGCVTTQRDSITVSASPQAGFSAPVLRCAQNEITYKDTSSGNIIDWFWRFGDANVATGASVASNAYASAGTYDVRLVVESANGCLDSVSQRVVVQPLPDLQVNYSIPDPCERRVQFINGSTGDAFIWHFGDGSDASQNTNPVHTYQMSGNYTATLNATLNGCADSTMLQVRLPELPNFSASYTQPTACAPSPVLFDAASAQNVDNARWEFGDGTTSFNLTQLHTYFAPGTYQARLQVQGGECLKDTVFQIMVGDTLLATVDIVQDVACFGAATGSLSVNVRSGNAPYSFAWTNGLNTNPASALAAGSYQVTVTDRLNCQVVVEGTVEQPTEALSTITVQARPISCYEFSDGLIEIAATGGTAPYRYLWENGNHSRLQEDLIAGNYTITITDRNGCELIQSISLAQPEPILIAFQTAPVCYNTTGSFTVIPSGGIPPYLISRSPSFEEVGNFYDNLPPGNYMVYLEDSNGCMSNATATITELPDWNFQFAPTQANLLKGDSIFLKPFISISQADFEWQPANLLQQPNGTATWTFPLLDTVLIRVKATDLFGCAKYADFTAYVKDTVAVYIPNAFTPGGGSISANGVNDGFTAYSNFPAVKRIKKMVIANKWGQILFEKDDFPLNIDSEGWDGTFNGEPQIQDEYAYRIVIEMVDGEVTYRGIVRLLR